MHTDGLGEVELGDGDVLAAGGLADGAEHAAAGAAGAALLADGGRRPGARHALCRGAAAAAAVAGQRGRDFAVEELQAVLVAAEHLEVVLDLLGRHVVREPRRDQRPP